MKHCGMHVPGAVEGVQLPKDDQCFAKSLGVRGGNVRMNRSNNQVVEVALEDGSSTLCMIPSKFNKKMWIKVGGILIIDRPVPLDGDAKITSNVISVLSPKDIKTLNRAGIVPMGDPACDQVAGVDSDITSDVDDIQPNPNHRQAVHYDLSDSDSG